MALQHRWDGSGIAFLRDTTIYTPHVARIAASSDAAADQHTARGRESVADSERLRLNDHGTRTGADRAELLESEAAARALLTSCYAPVFLSSFRLSLLHSPPFSRVHHEYECRR